jgi:hypothetical protein
MKKYALVVALLFTSPALAQITDVQNIATWSCSGSGASVSCPVTLPLPSTTTGNLIAVWTFWESTSTYAASVQDSNTHNNFVSAVGPTLQMAAGTPTSSQIFYAANIRGASGDVVTVKFAGPSTGSPAISHAGVVAVEYSGLDLVNPLDVVSAGYSNSGSPGGTFDSGWAPFGLLPPVTGTNQNVVIFGAAVSDATATASHGSTFTTILSSPVGAAVCGITEENIGQISANTFQHATATCTSTGNWAAQMAVFRIATWTVTGGSNPARPAQVQFADQFPGIDACAQTKAAIETTINGNNSPVVDSRGFISNGVPCAAAPMSPADTGTWFPSPGAWQFSAPLILGGWPT